MRLTLGAIKPESRCGRCDNTSELCARHFPTMHSVMLETTRVCCLGPTGGSVWASEEVTQAETCCGTLPKDVSLRLAPQESHGSRSK